MKFYHPNLLVRAEHSSYRLVYLFQIFACFSVVFLSVIVPFLTEKTNAFFTKSNLHYTRGITLKCVTSGGVNLRGLTSRQHSNDETLQRWPAVGDIVYDLTGVGVDPHTSETESVLLDN